MLKTNKYRWRIRSRPCTQTLSFAFSSTSETLQVWDCANKMYKQEGLRSFWKGIVPPVMVETPKRGWKVVFLGANSSYEQSIWTVAVLHFWTVPEGLSLWWRKVNCNGWSKIQCHIWKLFFARPILWLAWVPAWQRRSSSIRLRWWRWGGDALPSCLVWPRLGCSPTEPTSPWRHQHGGRAADQTFSYYWCCQECCTSDSQRGWVGKKRSPWQRHHRHDG